MGRNRYYLCARDLDTNKVKVISLSETEIYDKGSNQDNYCNKLEDIDYFTMQYDNPEHIIMYLVNIGKLDSFNNELFIVSRKGNNYVFLENIYCDYELADNLSQLVKERKGLIKGFHFDNDKILDKFISKMIYDLRFRKFIQSKNHNIYNKFVDYFSDYDDTRQLHQVKYRDSGWARLSYPLLRNIVEVMERYEYMKTADRVDEGAIYYQEKLYRKRHSQDEDIMKITDKEYDSNQLSLFDNNDNIEKDEQIKILSQFIDEIDIDTFDFDMDFRRVCINNKKFDCDELELEKLDCLDNRIKRLLYEFFMYKLLHNDDVEYIDLIKTTKEKIVRLISDDNLARNSFYAFSNLYKKMKTNTDKNKEYRKEIED